MGVRIRISELMPLLMQNVFAEASLRVFALVTDETKTEATSKGLAREEHCQEDLNFFRLS